MVYLITTLICQDKLKLELDFTFNEDFDKNSLYIWEDKGPNKVYWFLCFL